MDSLELELENENLKQGGQNAEQAGVMVTMVQRRKSEILEILLQADPAALAALRSAGMYEPRK